MGAFDDLYEQPGAAPAASPKLSGQGGAFADLWNKPSAQEQVAANLPESLYLAGFDTGIPLHPTVSKGLVQLGEGANSVIHGARQRYNEITGDKAMADHLRQDTADNGVVNDGKPMARDITHTLENEPEQNKLLDATDGNYLDTGAQGATIGNDSAMASVVKIHRA